MPSIINRTLDLDLERPGYVGKPELAALFDVTTKTIDAWVKAKILPPPVRITSRLRWPRAVIRAAVEAINSGTTPTAGHLHASEEAVS
jgi:predicted DNA-binding transcriptional regulator AlpA